MTVKGCPSAVIISLNLFERPQIDDMGDSIFLHFLRSPMEVEGNVGPDIPKPTTVKY